MHTAVKIDRVFLQLEGCRLIERFASFVAGDVAAECDQLMTDSTAQQQMALYEVCTF